MALPDPNPTDAEKVVSGSIPLQTTGSVYVPVPCPGNLTYFNIVSAATIAGNPATVTLAIDNVTVTGGSILTFPVAGTAAGTASYSTFSYNTTTIATGNSVLKVTTNGSTSTANTATFIARFRP